MSNFNSHRDNEVPTVEGTEPAAVKVRKETNKAKLHRANASFPMLQWALKEIGAVELGDGFYQCPDSWHKTDPKECEDGIIPKPEGKLMICGAESTSLLHVHCTDHACSLNSRTAYSIILYDEYDRHTPGNDPVKRADKRVFDKLAELDKAKADTKAA